MNENTIIKSDSIEIEIEQNAPDQFTLFLYGNITASFPDLIKENILKNATHLTFDFNKLKLLNSTGIKKLLQMLTAFNKIDISYINCPTIFIDQCNNIKGLVSPNRKVKTFYLPYYDEENDQAELVICDVSKITDKTAPEYKNRAGRILSFDKIPHQYFHFIDLQSE